MSGNFGYMGRSNSWGDLDQMWLLGRYGGRNHVCNISWLSVKGCVGVVRGVILPSPIDLTRGPYVWPCDGFIVQLVKHVFNVWAMLIHDTLQATSPFADAVISEALWSCAPLQHDRLLQCFVYQNGLLLQILCWVILEYSTTFLQTRRITIFLWLSACIRRGAVYSVFVLRFH